MPDSMDMIAEALENLTGDCSFVGRPRVVELADFKFTKYTAQSSEVLGISTEFVRQSEVGMSGDEFQGTIAYPIGGKMFVVDYAT